MDNDAYKTRYSTYVDLTEKRLRTLCDRYLPAEAEISRAARYSLFGGGKRVRAVLVLATCELFGGDVNSAADYAAALEMLHCYSLIHDDLPCMDNDDFRRGRPSCHCEFGEATALLAADALVTAAFEAIANAPLSAESRVHAAARLAYGAGARGMLYGQELDKRFEQERADAEQLLSLHRHKTGALILTGVQLGCEAAEVSSEQCQSLETYAEEIGLVFQIVDDILDVTSSTETLGKPVGSDAENEKTTFVTLYGLNGAKEMARQHNCAALTALEPFGKKADFLRILAESLLVRNK